MNIHILPQTDISKARQIWRKLESQVPDITLAARWIWTETWIEVYGDFIPHYFAYGEKNGTPVGIMLVVRETGRTLPFPVKSYSIGTGGEPLKERTHVLNKSVLVLPEHKNHFIKALVEQVTETFSWEELTLDFYRTEDQKSFLNVFDGKKMKYNVIREQEYIMDLKAIRESGKSVMDSLSSNTKYKIRRSLKGFGDDVTAEYGKTIEEALEIYKEMIVLHQKVWEDRGKRGMFASDRFTKFHEEIIRKLHPSKGAAMLRVKSKKFGTLGCIYLIIDRGDAMMYQTGFNTFDGVAFENNTNRNKIKPGLVSHALAMQLCMDELGVDIYNYGPAEYQYKAELTEVQRETCRVSVHNGIKPYLRDTFWDLYIKADHNKTAKAIIRPFYALYKKAS